MRGASCTAHTTTPHAVAGNTVFRASPPHLGSLRTTRVKSFAESMDASARRMKKEESNVTKYEFTLRFTLPSAGVDMDEVADRLYGHGCDDALVGIGHPGKIALDFSRKAPSARVALMSAITDVTKAVPGAILVEVAPDLVGVTDVADMVGRSRQNIRQLMVSCAGTVPAPVHEGKQALWHLAPVLSWLASEKNYRVSADLMELADATMRVNLAVDALQADPEVEDELRTLLT